MIVIGCAYSALSDLRRCLHSRGRVLCCSDVSGVGESFLETVNGERVDFDQIRSAFIRYPYDLIPPHTQTFQLRESVEFLKTISLILENISINPVSKCWALRNRVYSLNKASTFGLVVPHGKAISSDCSFSGNRACAVKALGNCFFAEKTTPQDREVIDLLSFEQESDGDSAYIFPASLLKCEDINRVVKNFGATYVQDAVISKNEIRAYVIGSDFFEYKHETGLKFDKSTLPYAPSRTIPECTAKKLISFTQYLDLGYLCLDLICNENNDIIVIDVNPYGSLPSFTLDPRPTQALADLLVGDVYD